MAGDSKSHSFGTLMMKGSLFEALLLYAIAIIIIEDKPTTWPEYTSAIGLAVIYFVLMKYLVVVLKHHGGKLCKKMVTVVLSENLTLTQSYICLISGGIPAAIVIYVLRNGGALSGTYKILAIICFLLFYSMARISLHEFIMKRKRQIHC